MFYYLLCQTHYCSFQNVKLPGWDEEEFTVHALKGKGKFYRTKMLFEKGIMYTVSLNMWHEA